MDISEKRGRPRKEKKKKQYTITMDVSLHDQFQEYANENGMSLSYLISLATKKYIKGDNENG